MRVFGYFLDKVAQDLPQGGKYLEAKGRKPLNQGRSVWKEGGNFFAWGRGQRESMALNGFFVHKRGGAKADRAFTFARWPYPQRGEAFLPLR